MENLQSSLSTPRSAPKVSLRSPSVAGGSGSCNAAVQAAKEMTPEEQLVLNLCNPESRGTTIVELSEKRAMFKDLAVLLWYSFGTMAILTKELVAVYPAVSKGTLSASASNRVCNVLALLQTIASHPETRTPFLRAELPNYFHPFLTCPYQGTAFECLRLTSLGVLGALVKVDDAEVINFLLQSDFIHPCLQIMEMGSENSKLVATYIIEKILLNDAGSTFICASVDSFFEVASVLATMVNALVENPSAKVLKHVICCYLGLTYHPKALVALRISFPEALKDGTFYNCLSVDPEAVQWLQQLLDRLNHDGAGASLPGPVPAAGGSVWQGVPQPGPGAAAGGSGGGMEG